MRNPRDEMFLAQLIQNAAANGLRSCRGNLFRSREGYSRLRRDEDKVACCAQGAAYLNGSTRRRLNKLQCEGSLSDGNDGLAKTYQHRDGDWYEVGQAFYDACRNLG